MGLDAHKLPILEGTVLVFAQALSSVPILTLGSRLDGFEHLLCAREFFENGPGGCGPDEGNRVLIVLGEIIVIGLLHPGDAFEGAAMDAFSGDLGEEALDHVEPGGRRQREEVPVRRMISNHAVSLRRQKYESRALDHLPRRVAACDQPFRDTAISVPEFSSPRNCTSSRKVEKPLSLTKY